MKNLLRSFIRNALLEGALPPSKISIVSVPGGITAQLKSYSAYIEPSEVSPDDQAALDAAEAAAPESRAWITSTLQKAIDKHPTEVGVAFDEEDHKERARALSMLLKEEAARLQGGYNYPYASGLYNVAWVNSIQDVSDTVPDIFADMFTRGRNSLDDLRKEIENSPIVQPSAQEVPLQEGIVTTTVAAGIATTIGHILFPRIFKKAASEEAGEFSIQASRWVFGKPDDWKRIIDSFKTGNVDNNAFLLFLRKIGDTALFNLFSKEAPALRAAVKKLWRAPEALRNNLTDDSMIRGVADDKILMSVRVPISDLLTSAGTTYPTKDQIKKHLLDHFGEGDLQLENLRGVARVWDAEKANPASRKTYEYTSQGGVTVTVSKQDAQAINTFFDDLSEALADIIKVAKSERRPAQALALGKFVLTAVAFHYIEKFIFESIFVGVNHLPISITDEHLAQLFTCAKLRSVSKAAIERILAEVDYGPYSQLKVADEQLAEVLGYFPQNPVTANQLLAIATLYDNFAAN